MTKIQIRGDDFADWRGLEDLLQDAFAYMDGRIDPPSSLHRMTADSLRQKAEEETLLLAFDEDRLIGCCFLADQGEIMYLGKLAVSTAMKSHGIGASLMTCALDICRAQGKQRVELQSRVELTEVHAFFRRFGFQQVSTTSHAGYDRPTSITMQLSL